MELVAHNPKAAKRLGIPQSVGKDFSEADKGRKFKEGGTAMVKKLFKGKETFGEEMKEAKAVKSGKISPKMFAKGEKMEGHKEEKNPLGLGKKIASGKMSPKQYADMESKEPKGYKKGGIIASSMGKVTAGGKRPHGEHTVQTKGHTKGKVISMRGAK